jgi:hypothetical protein
MGYEITKQGEKMHTRNPKQDGSNVFDCKPQSGKCKIDCNQCFYNREGAFYVDIHKPHMPSHGDVGDGIMRVNSGHDSNIERDMVISSTEVYPKRFFNTSIPKFDFPAPVVFTANAKEEDQPEMLPLPPDNIMFIRLRVSSTNLGYVYDAVKHYSLLGVPVVLTFMAYYDKEPESSHFYTWKQRHINSYWCPTREFMADVMRDMKRIGGRSVSLCSDLDGYKCEDCRNCETYYYQTIKHMKESRRES